MSDDDSQDRKKAIQLLTRCAGLAADSDGHARCSFCGKGKDEVGVLIKGGPSGNAHICMVCLAACTSMLDGKDT